MPGSQISLSFSPKRETRTRSLRKEEDVLSYFRGKRGRGHEGRDEHKVIAQGQRRSNKTAEKMWGEGKLA